jgi:hypothetical protein
LKKLSVVRISEAGFPELKDYLSNMTKLCPLKPKSPLLMYLSDSNSAVSVVLVQEKEEEGKPKQILVYFVLEVLSGSKLFYSELEKDSICSCDGHKKTKALFRGSQNKGYHEPDTEWPIHEQRSINSNHQMGC